MPSTLMPDPLQILIVDDERLARRSIRSALNGVAGVAVAGEAASIDAAAEQIRTEAPDVVLLDVQMRGETGFDLLDRVEAPVQVVFITAHDEYAVRAFEVNALDYLLKPVDPDRLAEALRRTRQAETALPEDEDTDPEGLAYDDLFFYEDGRRPRFIRVREIICIEAAGNYTEAPRCGRHHGPHLHDALDVDRPTARCSFRPDPPLHDRQRRARGHRRAGRRPDLQRPR